VNKRLLIIVIGAVLGYVYYALIGCTNGCAITGSPFNSTIYGALIGFVWGWPKKQEREK
jgi:hypothetical protein